jgi:hypothetical protein
MTWANHDSQDKEWDEFDYERFMRECDARTDRYAELMEKYMDHPDRERLIAREMGWTCLEEALDAQGQGIGKCFDSKEDTRDFEPGADGFEPPEDAPGLEPDPATEGVDWVRKEDGYICHPLSLRALEGSIGLWDKFEELGLDKSEDEDLCRLLGEYQTTSAKLAGALDGLAYGRRLSEGAFIVACLKRALSHLHTAQAALESVTKKELLRAEILASTRREFFALREEILRLMTDFRGQR